MVSVDTKVMVLERLLLAYQRLMRMLNDESKSDLEHNWNEAHSRYLAYAKLSGVVFDCEGVSAHEDQKRGSDRFGENGLTVLGHNEISNIRRELESGGTKEDIQSGLNIVFDKFSALLARMASEIRNS